MRKRRPGILIFGGFDPSGGAGILADAKTAEALRVSAAGCVTAQTVQSAVRAQRVQWTDDGLLAEQLERLLADAPLAETPPAAVKLGLLRDAGQARLLLDRVHRAAPGAPVVWDPVLAASAGLDFHGGREAFAGWRELLDRVALFTPNRDELTRLVPDRAPEEAAAALAGEHPGLTVWLKGGHDPARPGLDRLYTGGKVRVLAPRTPGVSPKHGSGCVLSTAAAAYLARGYDRQRAALRAKRYTERFLASSPDLLGHHAA